MQNIRRSEWLIWQKHTWTCCYLFIPAAMKTEYCRSEWLIWLKHNWTCCYLFIYLWLHPAICFIIYMNGQCTLCKHDKLKGLYQFRRSNLRADLIHYKIKRNKFTALCKQCKQIYCKSKRTELIDSRNDNKKYWSMLKNCNKA